ncbi:HET-domain-containing protein [Xylaria cubensis]|nr:HET-domain-containing protein [Xylaria cubensis]
MHLLNVHTKQLQEFLGDRKPPYAILSHTWGDEEVLFQDLSRPGHRKKLGYKKIKACCERAILDGYEFVWVDTCCIDKSSSAELSEAINSMFRWYGEAGVCYVYLTDVYWQGDSDDTYYVFRNSRWFTRGWTLQELIAPTDLRFFDTTWSMMFRINKKSVSDQHSSKSYMIEKTTGIGGWYSYAFKKLNNVKRLADVPVATKLSWVSERRTTRVEDIAYCLLGLLDVNMPLLYGEGQKAFLRLQEEFLKKHDDPSIVCWGLGMDCLELNVESSFDTSCLASTPLLFRGFKGITPKNIPVASLSMRIGWTIDAQQDIYVGVTNIYNGISRLTIPLRKVGGLEIYYRIPSCAPFFLSWARYIPSVDKFERHRKTINLCNQPFYHLFREGTWTVSPSLKGPEVDIAALYEAGFVLDSIYPPPNLLGFHFTPTHTIFVLHRGQRDTLYLRVTCLRSQLRKLTGRELCRAALFSCPYKSKRSAIEVWDAGRRAWERCFQKTLQLSWQETTTIHCKKRVEHISSYWNRDEELCVLKVRKVRLAYSDEEIPIHDEDWPLWSEIYA